MDNGSTDPADMEARRNRKKQKDIAKAAKKAAKNRPSRITSISGSQSQAPSGLKKMKRKSQ